MNADAKRNLRPSGDAVARLELAKLQEGLGLVIDDLLGLTDAAEDMTSR